MKIARFILIGCILSIGTVAFSQGPESIPEEQESVAVNTPGEIADAQTERMIELLSLNEEQVEQVRALNLKLATKLEVIRNDETMTPERKKEFVQGNHNDHKTMMKTILTEEQFVTYEEHLAAKKHRVEE